MRPEHHNGVDSGEQNALPDFETGSHSQEGTARRACVLWVRMRGTSATLENS